ncbi:hypothetical protein GCM10011529_08170 [Polymorphobacter glacialis]|uniref:Uncharacterized protein n=1 Tax=Sandarakinorhabdus glacialis TaxID=1614636 RepID=A0A916ZLY6_9SPHN|nr:hypothetical protein [Polymorphobacter glacialis]GGE04172.1 hypothetical protein GCM10011529_08170 [Polymorphobacter glacialis]
MQDPSPRTSRLILTAGFGVAIAIGGVGFTLGQRAATDRLAVTAEAPASAPAPVPMSSPPETVSRVLGRQDVVMLAAKAADAKARGVAIGAATGGTAIDAATRGTGPAEAGVAVGRRFSIELPFGCGGPSTADSDAAMRWRYDEKAGALRLHVAPIAWSPGEWLAAGPVTDGETIEGFWIARPWANSEACPTNDPVAASGVYPVLLPGQTLAIGEFFGSEDVRQGRRDGRAYTSVLRMTADAVRGEQGFRVRLSGRIAAAPDGSLVACRQPGGAEQRPICIVLATFDEVAIENAATGETLTIWDVAGTGRIEERVRGTVGNGAN